MLIPSVEALDFEAALLHMATHGYARLGHALDDRGLTELRTRSDDLMLGRVVYEGMFFQRDAPNGAYSDLPRGRGHLGPSLHYRKVEKLELDPLFYSWIANPLFGRIARASISGDVALCRAVLWNKAAQGGTALPWHQDGGRFWGLSQQPTLQIWTALDDATEESGCMEVLPGSHLRGLAKPQGGVLHEPDLAAAQAEDRRVSVPAKAGEVILLHNLTWHRSGTNRTMTPRRAISICYMSAETRCLRKRRAPRTFLTVFQGGSEGPAGPPVPEVNAVSSGARSVEPATGRRWSDSEA